MATFVIAKSFGGKPVRLVEIERVENLVYVAAEDSLERVKNGESYPVGVPEEDVLPFSNAVYDALMAAWENGAIDAIWKRERSKLASRG